MYEEEQQSGSADVASGTTGDEGPAAKKARVEGAAEAETETEKAKAKRLKEEEETRQKEEKDKPFWKPCDDQKDLTKFKKKI